eukprot:GEMP01048578.1.p1 GENE.GEMP01048578.1~~GEMP01048578.1.p1  ORF type:complete len:129 (+),score=6.10 GEMP01048578.1:134-520(+)
MRRSAFRTYSHVAMFFLFFPIRFRYFSFFLREKNKKHVFVTRLNVFSQLPLRDTPFGLLHYLRLRAPPFERTQRKIPRRWRRAKARLGDPNCFVVVETRACVSAVWFLYGAAIFEILVHATKYVLNVS